MPSKTAQQPVLDAPESGLAGEPGKGRRIGSRHPGLSAQPEDLLKQRGSPLGVEMGGHLVEQKDGRGLTAAGDELGVGEDKADKQSLLLAS